MPDATEPATEDSKGDHCPRCLQAVPPKASRCPGCGQPIRSMRSATFAIGIAGLLVLLFAMLVMYQLVANEEALNAPVPVDENADQQQGIFPDPPQAGTADEPAMPYPTTKPDQPTKPEKKAPLDER